MEPLRADIELRIFRESIRQHMLDVLKDTTFTTPLECDIELNAFQYESSMCDNPRIVAICKDSDDQIWYKYDWMDKDDEEDWLDMDMMWTDDLVTIVDALEK